MHDHSIRVRHYISGGHEVIEPVAATGYRAVSAHPGGRSIYYIVRIADGRIVIGPVARGMVGTYLADAAHVVIDHD